MNDNPDAPFLSADFREWEEELYGKGSNDLHGKARGRRIAAMLEELERRGDPLYDQGPAGHNWYGEPGGEALR